MVLFSEDHIQETRRRGRIEVICGSMFSGKTEELIRRMKRAKFAKQRVEIFKPAIDTRYSEEDVVSHDSHSIASTPIDSSASILLFTSEIDVVGIDEAQFFDSGLIDVCNPTSLLTMESVLSLQGWIWTSKEIRSVQCHNCAPLPMKSPKFMRSV